MRIHGEPGFEAWVSQIRAFCDDVARRLPGRGLENIHELLENGEPNEALITLAWLIATEQLVVDRVWLDLIESMVGDPLDLPADLSGQKRPVRSRRQVANGLHAN